MHSSFLMLLILYSLIARALLILTSSLTWFAFILFCTKLAFLEFHTDHAVQLQGIYGIFGACKLGYTTEEGLLMVVVHQEYLVISILLCECYKIYYTVKQVPICLLNRITEKMESNFIDKRDPFLWLTWFFFYDEVFIAQTSLNNCFWTFPV